MRIAAVVLAFLAAGLARGEEPLFVLQDACVRCHLLGEDGRKDNSVLAWKQSVHFSAQSSCADCHGGDRLLYMDFAKGHMGLPTRAEALAACAKCHPALADPAATRPVAFGRQDTCTADCITCHGYHAVQKPGAHLLNAANCDPCHQDPAPARAVGQAA
ncbi:MAG: hypothetical protein JRI97_10055, partial [Deltaproteobacteria bacterium]|nr:hypothetical protein [Deltaproteobacteria bacterium]